MSGDRDYKTISIWEKILYVFDRKQKIRAAILFVVIIIGAFVELLGVGSILPFINALLTPKELRSNPVTSAIYRGIGFENDRDFIIFLGLSIVVVYIIKNIYVYLMHSFQYRYTYDNQRLLSYRMMDCYMRQSYIFHIGHNSAELIRNINEDVVSFFEAILAGLQLASEGGVCLALLVFLLIQDAAITLGVIAMVAAFGMVFIKVFRRRLRRAGRESRDAQARLRQTLQEALGSIKEVLVLGREDYFTDRYDREYRHYADSNRRFKVYSMIPKPVMETAAICSLLLIVCLKLALGEEPTGFVATMSLFAMAAFRLLPSANRIAEYLSRIMFSKPAIDAIYHDLREIEEMDVTKPQGEPLGTDLPFGQGEPLGTDLPFGQGEPLGTDLPFEREISIQGLTFRYPEGDRDIFHEACLTIPKNSSVAFIGPSGGGKTTMADILLGLLSPASGQVSCDGIDISHHMKEWRKKLGYIPQTISLLDASIRENILFGTPPVLADETRLQRAVEEAQLSGLIDGLEEGLDTIIGEGGVKLSGGQRQRIGIARALYGDPEILVLDEATSALDNDTEAAVMEAIDHLAGQKTLLIIAHRLSTIENCNIVYKIEGGRAERENKE